jgi:acyl-CoA synthetase (AMP-forming)/AMP-acid ligase II
MTDAPSSANIAALLHARATERPDATALIFPNGRGGWIEWTYAQVRDRAWQYAAGFTASGVVRGDRVLMLMKPSHEFYGVLFGLLAVGAVPVLLDPGMGVKNVLACVGEANCRAMVAIPPAHVVRLFARSTFASVELPFTAGSRWFWGGLTLDHVLAAAGDTPFELPSFAPADEAAIVFTSGSTGTPKGVSFRHGMFDAVTSILGGAFALGPGRTTVETFAAFVLIDLALGMRAVIPDMDMSKPAQADPNKVLDAFLAHDADVAFASPVVLRKLVGAAQDRKVTLPRLRTVLSGVAPVPGALHAALREVAPAVDLRVNYGATECLTVAAIGTDEVLGETWARTKRGDGTCVGHVLPSMRVAIAPVTEDSLGTWQGDRALPSGEIGEILVSGPVASPEYKDRPDANALAKVPDASGSFWHRTGDLGWVDEQGRLWFCGRKTHRVQTGASFVPCVPVEGVFNDHPAVRRSALVGEGPRGDEQPVLLVELHSGVAWTDAMSADLLALAAGTRWEGTVTRVQSHPGFPVDARHNAKIRRDDLRAELGGTR